MSGRFSSEPIYEPVCDPVKTACNVHVCSELRSCVKVEVAVLGSPSLIILRVSVDIKHHKKKGGGVGEGGGLREHSVLVPLDCMWKLGVSFLVFRTGGRPNG